MAQPIQKPGAAPLTAAETALIEQFGERCHDLPGSSATVVARDRAIEAIKAHRLPTRRVEAWHYTDLRRLLADVPAWRHQVAARPVDTVVEGAARIAIVNGELVERAAPEGLKVDAVSDGLRADVGGIGLAVADDPADCEDAIDLINTAFVSDGVRISVAEGLSVGQPVEIQSIHDGGQTHTRNQVSVGAGASALFIERHVGTGEPLLASTVTDIVVKSGADLTWLIVQEQGAGATHLGSLTLRLEQDAKATVFIANLGGKLVRQELHAAAAGENADLTFRAVNLVGDRNHCDVTLELDHLVANTTSTETVRNVVTDRGQGVFQGQIRVAQIAQKTDAQMACNTLLLSDHAGFAAKPELEIFADDVICAHGATVAEIDEDHLFYLMARGITEKAARGLLIEAFVDEIVEELDNEEIIAALEERIATWLEAHG